MKYTRKGSYTFDVIEIARYTTSCTGCARTKAIPAAPLELRPGEYEELKAMGVPEMDMEEFDSYTMAEIKQLDILFREWLKEEESGQGRLL